MKSLFRQRRVLSFMFVGGIGFIIDGGLLTHLMQSGWKSFSARSVSFISAVTMTWLLNRLWTFRLERISTMHKEYTLYFTVQAIGASINLGIYFLVIKFHPTLIEAPLIPLSIGAFLSMIFNYLALNRCVFNRRFYG